MARQIKRFIETMSVEETCAIAVLAYKETLIDKEKGDQLIDMLLRLAFDDLCERYPEMRSQYPAYETFFESLDAWAVSFKCYTTDDFFAYIGVKRSEGPPFYRARKTFESHCKKLGVPIKGYF